MKLRLGFVSNSSSAAFILEKSFLSLSEYEDLKEVLKEAETSEWVFNEDEHVISGNTMMDNFGLEDEIINLGIDPRAFEFSDEGCFIISDGIISMYKEDVERYDGEE